MDAAMGIMRNISLVVCSSFKSNASLSPDEEIKGFLRGGDGGAVAEAGGAEEGADGAAR